MDAATTKATTSLQNNSLTMDQVITPASRQIALTSFHKFPVLNEDCRRLIWQTSVLDEKVVEVKVDFIWPKNGHRTAHLTVINFWSFKTAFANQEARKITLSTLRMENMMVNSGLIFYMKLPTWRLLWGLERARLKVPGTLSEPLDFSKDTIFPIRLSKITFDCAFSTTNLEHLNKIKNLRTLFIVADPVFQQASTRSTSVFVQSTCGIGYCDAEFSSLPWHHDICQAYKRVREKRRTLLGRLKAYASNKYTREAFNIQIVRWQVPNDINWLTNIGRSDLEAAELAVARDTNRQAFLGDIQQGMLKRSRKRKRSEPCEPLESFSSQETRDVERDISITMRDLRLSGTV